MTTQSKEEAKIISLSYFIYFLLGIFKNVLSCVPKCINTPLNRPT